MRTKVSIEKFLVSNGKEIANIVFSSLPEDMKGMLLMGLLKIVEDQYNVEFVGEEEL